MSGVQSIQRAFALLRVLAAGPAGVTELADRTQLPKSTVSRILSTLEAEGAVAQDDDGSEYRIGGTLAELSGAVGPGSNLVAAAQPLLQELTDALGETAGMAVLDHDEVRYLLQTESAEEVQVRNWVGDSTPLHLVPSGLVLLADMDPDQIDSYLARPLERLTPDSVVDPMTIRARLEQVRTDGHVWAQAEFDESLNSVAAAVRDSEGAAIAAIHVHGPAYRFPEIEDDPEIAELVKEAADRLSGWLS